MILEKYEVGEYSPREKIPSEEGGTPYVCKLGDYLLSRLKDGVKKITVNRDSEKGNLKVKSDEKPVFEIDPKYHNALRSRFVILTGLDLSRQDLDQDGKISFYFYHNPTEAYHASVFIPGRDKGGLELEIESNQFRK